MKQENGFTIVELLIYMALLSVFLLTLTNLLTSTLNLQTESSAVTYVESDNDYIRSRLQYDIRRSTAITTPAAVGSSATSLSLTISGATFTYTVQNGALVLTQAGVSGQLNTSDTTVSDFSVTRIGNGTGKDTFQVTYTITSVASIAGKGATVKTVTETIGAR